MITVLYDGKCGLCRREIDYYQRIAPSGIFLWSDITEHDDALNHYNIKLVDALRRLHVVDNEKQLHIGVDAFITIWQQLPRWQILSRLVKIPGIYSVSKFTYHHFANWRFKRLAHCQIAKRSQK